MTISTKHPLSDEATRELEEQFPALAALATNAAYERAKRSGQTIVLSKNGFIVAELPDGTEQILSQAQPRHKVTPGVRFAIGAKRFPISETD
ncbi:MULTISPECIES: hypothetical protein [Pseudomonas]|uniref:Uncharacterized protein n=1 Tax=Pseudomonas neustonica TaxID=2487346 RepID=A0ABX9XF81_9PSED|nr:MULTISPECIES: hypothetical protein [Pseudomonas]MBA6421264.1 hypothetical protein [Pseudomonas sp. 5Ae-yellow]ROZ80131.1 hypothetical protein EF099_18670 [Pseudomonas sp. SSM44]ROZ80973.1 hypothetical protein EF096_18475 [Pseudomonas neustonica]|tara:strand:+ start:2601 stop:2876 length:276 start_codon:yes stop_codon:yes gene_type:complete